MASKSTVKFEDFSVQVKGAINDNILNWLRETAGEIAARAKRNCVSKSSDKGKQLNQSYDYNVDEGDATAQIGSPLEAAYWEEWGTGSHAAHGDGRKGWWVYIEGGSGYHGKTSYYATQDEAEAVAAGMREEGFDAYASNGTEPHYTLEKAFEAVMKPAIAELERRMKGMGD